jgi:serine/threonine-protein kinase
VTDAVPRLSVALSDRYRIERELGQGGMATVYLAQDLKHDRKVAVKVLKPVLAAVLGADRFLAEIKVTANLQHPNLLPLFDSGEAGGFLYYVMPYVEGETLRARLERERQLPVDETVRLVTLLANALDYAHAQGVIHRDLKPENILLPAGQPVIADFGIALAVAQAGGSRVTETGLSLGTPHYMSPEQAAGDRELNAKSDQYALGAVTYEMLSGEPPHTGPTAQAIIARLMTEKPRSLRATRSSVPVAMDLAIGRALAKPPADRFPTCGAFARALVTSPVSRTRRWLIGAALAGLAIAAIAATAWFAGRVMHSGDGPRFERIAVLPMDNQTGDTTQGFFADGMTREVIGILGDAGLRVLGHRAVAPYRNSTMPTADIAEALRVDAIVSGAVLMAGDMVQISAELTDPKTGESLWARTFSRPAADVVTLQHDFASEIARGVRARLTPDQARALAPARPVNPKAYTQYLLGQQQATLRTPDGFSRSVEYLTRSLALDSTFAPAWAALAMANAYGLLYQLTPRDSGRAVIELAAARAAALDERLADPWFARGVAHLHADWNFAAAEDDFRRGLERNGSTEARGLYGWTMWETGRFAEAIAATKELIALEPTTAQWRSDIAWSYWSSGDSVAARASLRHAIAVDSSFYEAYDLLGMVESDAGDFTASERYHQRAIAVAGGDYWVRQFSEAVLYKARGDLSGVRRVLRELDGDPRYAQRAVMSYLVGEKDSTYALLERAIEARDGDLLWVLTAVPYLYPLHREARYQTLMRRVGLLAGRHG